METLAFGIVVAAGFLAYGIYSAAHTINSSLLEREAGRPLTAHDANVWAVPAPWPHDAESHADDLERQAAETMRLRSASCSGP